VNVLASLTSGFLISFHPSFDNSLFDSRRPVGATNYVLETAASPAAISWDQVMNSPTVRARERNAQLPVTGDAKFFCLRSP